MSVPADRDLVQELIATRAAQVVEVLPRAEYDWAHIAGAAHLWLREMDAATVAQRLDSARPVVVYCNDFQ
ncbi:MAG: rhodanese-like domain-containing protein [Acidimicrobiales bacterium]